MYRLIDTHSHLEQIENIDSVLAGAKEAGIVAIIAVGSDSDSNKKVLELARHYAGLVYPALGLHPWFIREPEIESSLDFMEAHIEEAVALGEVGLDYHKRVRERAEKDLQKDVLRDVLEVARSHNKPALIHSRYAWRDALTAVEEAGVEKVVFHWYTGTSGVLRDIIDRGYFISATPAVEYHEEHRRAVKETPLEKLLLETDSPVVYGRGSNFEYESRPADVLRSLRGAAALKGRDESEIAGITTENAVRFFGIGR